MATNTTGMILNEKTFQSTQIKIEDNNLSAELGITEPFIDMEAARLTDLNHKRLKSMVEREMQAKRMREVLKQEELDVSNMVSIDPYQQQLFTQTKPDSHYGQVRSCAREPDKYVYLTRLKNIQILSVNARNKSSVGNCNKLNATKSSFGLSGKQPLRKQTQSIKMKMSAEKSVAPVEAKSREYYNKLCVRQTFLKDDNLFKNVFRE